jgi:regulatory protein
MEFYLKRKEASPPLIQQILNKLSYLDLLDDRKLAAAYIHDRTLQRPTSRRKIMLELRKKHVADEIISEALNSAVVTDDRTALRDLVERKRRQSKYKDNLKLMQYLARQGFNYDDIKTVLNEPYGEEL